MRLIYIIGLVFFSSSVLAEWKKISQDNEKIYFVESRMIIPHIDGRRMARELHEFHKALNDGTTSLRIQSEFDCNKNEARILVMDGVAGEMGVGKVVSLQENPSKWEFLGPDNSRKEVLEFVCAH